MYLLPTKFRKGQTVELSIHGYEQGLDKGIHANFGKVIKYDKGILYVKRFGCDKVETFLPYYWAVSSISRQKQVTKHYYLLEEDNTT